jgi:chromosomal replication initiation ATPase DnaA
MRASRANVEPFLPDDASPAKIFAANPPLLGEIIAATCAHYRLDPARIADGGYSPSAASFVRNVISYQARLYTHLSGEKIGTALGRTESTVRAGENKVTGRLTVDEHLRDDLDIIARRIAIAVLKRGGRPCL